MSDDAVTLAREVLEQIHSHPYMTVYTLARALLAAHDENERLRAGLRRALDALDEVREMEGRSPMNSGEIAELRKLVGP